MNRRLDRVLAAAAVISVVLLAGFFLHQGVGHDLALAIRNSLGEGEE
jgi:hypothetical protein